MNLLLINGSPKGSQSNSLRLADAFVEGLSGAEAAAGRGVPAVERISTARLSIAPCCGCFACWNKTPGECCLKDDMADVLKKLFWADVTIWSFPLYYFSLPGQLKNLIDRQLPLSLPFMSAAAKSGGHPARYDMSGKRTVLISTCGFYTPSGNYDSVTALFDRLCGKGAYTTLFCGEGELFHVRELSARTDEYLALVRQAGGEYAQGGISEHTQARLAVPLYPRDVFEAMADASWGVAENGEPADDALTFTRQMAALYQKSAYPGKDVVLEMHYTDPDKTYRIVLGRDGSRVTDAFTGGYTTRISTPLPVWKAIAAGELSGAEAMMRGLYRVEGDFDLMLHWGDYFGAPRAEDPAVPGQPSVQPPKTDMKLLLAPWVVFWVAAAIDAYWGSLLSLAVCLLLPLAGQARRLTLYDALSAAAVGGCCLALLGGASILFVLPLAYFLFGIMWGLSVFAKVPLTAWYSMQGYGGRDALKNPLFLKTNRILTAVWAVLYLLTPIWTCAILRTDAASCVGAINSVLPALMGAFTSWFQKWYPRHVVCGGRGR